MNNEHTKELKLEEAFPTNAFLHYYLEKIMNKIITSAVAALIIATPSLFADMNSLPIDEDADMNKVVVGFDRAGLNNYECISLYNKNFSIYEKLFSKRAIREGAISSINYLVFDEMVYPIGVINEDRPSKLYRDIQPLLAEVKDSMQYDTKTKAKDIVGALHYIQALSENIDEDTHVIVILFSNLRDSMHTKEQLKAMQPIKLKNNVSLVIYASSGLSCLKETVSISAQLNAEKSYANFFKSKIVGDVHIYTMYGGN